jgi:hypothetical protein
MPRGAGVGDEVEGDALPAKELVGLLLRVNAVYGVAVAHPSIEMRLARPGSAGDGFGAWTLVGVLETWVAVLVPTPRTRAMAVLLRTDATTPSTSSSPL